MMSTPVILGLRDESVGFGWSIYWQFARLRKSMSSARLVVEIRRQCNAVVGLAILQACVILGSHVGEPVIKNEIIGGEYRGDMPEKPTTKTNTSKFRTITTPRGESGGGRVRYG